MNTSKIRKSKYKLNHYYFDDIDCEHKAYWLGFLYADGYHHESRYRIKLSIQEQDGYILEQFKKDIQSNKPIDRMFIEKNIRKPFSYGISRLTEFHKIRLLKPTWTLVITGPRKNNNWGYLTSRGFVQFDDYRKEKNA